MFWKTTLFLTATVAMMLTAFEAFSEPRALENLRGRGAVDPDALDLEALDAPPPVVARDCTPEETDWVRALIADDAPPREYRVYLDCSLQFEPDDVVYKRLILEGPEASGVTIGCNGAKIDGGRDTPNANEEMIQVVSRLEGTDWKRPSHITVRDCNIVGKIRIWGMGRNGEAAAVRESSRLDADHVKRVKNAAPRGITLDNLTITATGTALYIAPGVTFVTLRNSELKGSGTRTAIYLDAESARNTIENNYIHVKIFDEWFLGVNRLGPQISVDTSSNNQITDNWFSALEGGGIYLYRNCGEGGTVRHGSSKNNQILRNAFPYNVYDGDNPAVFIGSKGQWYRSFLDLGFCDEDDGFPWGSSYSDDDHAQNNVVEDNQICKLPVERMIREGDSSNRPNVIQNNKTISTGDSWEAGDYSGVC